MANLSPEVPGLLRLVLELAHPDNSDLLDRFRKSPQEVMTSEYGLTEQEQAIVLSGDLTELRRAIDQAYEQWGGELPTNGDVYAMVVTWGPPPPPVMRSIVVWG